MYRYILKRIAFALVTLFFIVTITFFLMHAVPGGPFTGEKTLKPEILENLNKKYGLDKPLVVQYGNYLLSLIKLDLGPSYSQIGTSVNEIISRSFPTSAKLGHRKLPV